MTTEQASERALARLLHWYQTDLPGPERLDEEAEKLTPRDEAFYHRFLDLSVLGVEIERGETK